MNDDTFIISGFDGDTGNQPPFAVDFSKAKKLDRSGSTCDAYECTIQHRRVFVKRLKTEYRDNPLYRAAFSKEYDLGISLSHPSLPRYVGFGDDYIVMDFVEGDTLADLIKRDDIRLKNKPFARKLLLELIDVVEYLHHRNIIHCDIKPDNIIVSPYADRPATLIDFDKAYSPWLDSTHGDTAKYDCDGCADGTVDFKAIGLISGKLGLKRVDKACSRGDVSADYLRQLLAGESKKRLIDVFVAIVVGASVAAILLYRANSENETDSITSDSTIVIDTRLEVVPSEKFLPPAESAPVHPVAPPKPAIDHAWISSLIAENLGNDDEYRLKLLVILDSDTIPNIEKTDAINAYLSNYLAASSKIIHAAVAHYSDISELEVQKVVRSHPQWLRLEKEQEKMLTRLQDLYAAKESRRSSGHPASQPDTIPGEILPAQHR